MSAALSAAPRQMRRPLPESARVERLPPGLESCEVDGCCPRTAVSATCPEIVKSKRAMTQDAFGRA
jgi:hypothetical protein